MVVVDMNIPKNCGNCPFILPTENGKGKCHLKEDMKLDYINKPIDCPIICYISYKEVEKAKANRNDLFSAMKGEGGWLI